MFDTLQGFSIFFFSVSGLLLIGIIWEEKFLSLEDKIDAKIIELKKRWKK